MAINIHTTCMQWYYSKWNKNTNLIPANNYTQLHGCTQWLLKMPNWMTANLTLKTQILKHTYLLQPLPWPTVTVAEARLLAYEEWQVQALPPLLSNLQTGARPWLLVWATPLPLRPGLARGPAATQLEMQQLTQSLRCHCQLLPVIEKKTVYSGMCLFMLM